MTKQRKRVKKRNPYVELVVRKSGSGSHRRTNKQLRKQLNLECRLED
jgi:hypothetical protein